MTSSKPSVKSERADLPAARNGKEHRICRTRVRTDPLSKLNLGEMEILRLLSAGKSLSEIAWLVTPLRRSPTRPSIMRQKLGVRTSVELVRFAIESGVA